MARAVDCIHPAHNDVHATADNDEELINVVRQHIQAEHPDMDPEEAVDIVAQSAYDEPEPAA